MASFISKGRLKKMIHALVVLLLWPAMAARALESPVTWSAVWKSGRVHTGETFTVRLSARIDPGWHIYSISQSSGGPKRTVITVPSQQPFESAGFVSGPIPHTRYDPSFEMKTETYDHAASFSVPLRTLRQTPPDRTSVRVEIVYQACNDRVCLSPKVEHLDVPLPAKRN